MTHALNTNYNLPFNPEMQRSCVLQCWFYLKKRDFQRHKGCSMFKTNKGAGVMYCLVENLLCEWVVLPCFIVHHKFFMMSLQNHNSAQLHSKGLWTLANLLINIWVLRQFLCFTINITSSFNTFQYVESVCVSICDSGNCTNHCCHSFSSVSHCY